jgi:hypothetical protein
VGRKVMVISRMRMEGRRERLKGRCHCRMSKNRLRLLNRPLSGKSRRVKLIITGIVTVSRYHVLAIHASTVPRALDESRVTLAIL